MIGTTIAIPVSMYERNGWYLGSLPGAACMDKGPQPEPPSLHPPPTSPLRELLWEPATNF